MHNPVRNLVLGHLVHHCHEQTAALFAQESALFLEDARVVSAESADSGLGTISKGHRTTMALRRELCDAIRSGDVSYGAKLCNLHFPSVLLPRPCKEPVFGQCPESLLNQVDDGHEGLDLATCALAFTRRLPRSRWSECKAVVVDATGRLDPLRLGLEIYTQLFIESNRPMPSEMLESSVHSSLSSTTTTTDSDSSHAGGTAQLARLDDLHRYAQTYLSQPALLHPPSPHQPPSTTTAMTVLRAEFMAQVNQVSSIIAYPNPERSPCARWMDQERRTRLAEDLNDAILLHLGQEARSSLEQAVRQVTVVRRILSAEQVREPKEDKKTGVRINFISILPGLNDGEYALGLLKSLAAQVKPIMKRLSLEINSLEEYEWNTVFAGRNWNGGETVELVLRQRNGTFFPFGALLGVLIHELAHIRHMNHGPQFWKFNAEMKGQVLALRKAGYYGDGFWSDGRRMNGALVGGESHLFDSRPLDFPEYTCGGAREAAKRPSMKKRKRRSRAPGTAPSSSRRAATAGSRVRRRDAFLGQANVLVQDGDTVGGGPGGEDKTGFGFRKSTKTKKAKSAAADAAERRLASAAAAAAAASKEAKSGSASSTDDEWEWSDGDGRELEDDALRSERQNEMGREELEQLRNEFGERPGASTSAPVKAEPTVVDLISSPERPWPRPSPSAVWICPVCTEHGLGDGVNALGQDRCHLCESRRPPS